MARLGDIEVIINVVERHRFCPLWEPRLPLMIFPDARAAYWTKERLGLVAIGVAKFNDWKSHILVRADEVDEIKQRRHFGFLRGLVRWPQKRS